MRWFVLICVSLPNHTWCGRRRARELAHLAVRQQAAVGVGAGATGPRPSRGPGLWELPWAHEGARGAGAPGRGPPLPLQSGPGARAGLLGAQPLQLWGEVLVRCGGGFSPLLRARATAGRCGSRLWRDGGRCFFISCSLPLPLHARGEEGAYVMLLVSFKLRKERCKLKFYSPQHKVKIKQHNMVMNSFFSSLSQSCLFLSSCRVTHCSSAHFRSWQVNIQIQLVTGSASIYCATYYTLYDLV